MLGVGWHRLLLRKVENLLAMIFSVAVVPREERFRRAAQIGGSTRVERGGDPLRGGTLLNRQCTVEPR